MCKRFCCLLLMLTILLGVAAPAQARASADIGDVVTFGRFEQDGNTQNGKEPIRWVVLNREGAYALLYAVNILDVCAYDVDGNSQSWQDSSLRLWLNTTFYQDSFTDEDERYFRSGKPFDNSLFTREDRIFLLDYDGLNTPLLNGLGLGTIFNASHLRTTIYANFGLEEFFYAPPTAYASSRDKTGKGCEYYWDLTASLANNQPDGAFYFGRDMKDAFGVRPACWVDVKTLEVEKKERQSLMLESGPLLEIGNVVTFGHYEQDGNTTNGKEPIKWVVLKRENGYALLYAVNILDVQPYDTKGTLDNWLGCSLRTWLNGSFRSSAFTAGEQSSLRSGKPFNNKFFADTDQVFLLAYDYECTPLMRITGLGGLFIPSNYRGTEYENSGIEKFEYARPTVYALQKNQFGCTYYWEMNGSMSENKKDGVFYTGNSKLVRGVRPACWVDESVLTPLEESEEGPIAMVKIRDSMNVYLRATPSMNADVLGLALKGVVYPCTEVNGDWYLITIEDGTTGYVPASMSELMN